jgi:uncharacterized protein YllA (UPF0747 family)
MSGLDTSKGDYMQQANQIWSMLDEMSKNDPKAYENMIQENLEYGKKEIEKKKKEEKDFSLRTFDESKNWISRLVFPIERVTMQVFKEDDEDLGVRSKFVMDFEEGKGDGKNKDKSSLNLSKWAKEGKFYLNVF